MKLLTKLTLFITVSKLVIVLVFIGLLPSFIERISFNYADYYLNRQKEKVLSNIQKNGLKYYLDQDSSYGSYTMLKEEYVSIEPFKNSSITEVTTAPRIIESDTLSYRILAYPFQYGQLTYVIEIGKQVELISQFSRPLQRIALYILAGLILSTAIADLLFTRRLLQPLKKIIASKLGRTLPFTEPIQQVSTSTSDFRELDQALINMMHRINHDFEREREFTSNASHELLTPIGILQSKMENLVMEETLDEKASEKLLGMMKTLHRLNKIVQSLLMISRIDSEQYDRTDQVCLKDLIDDIIEELSHRIDEKELRVISNLKASVVLHTVHRDLLYQMFFNLATNAIRYNKESGEIRFEEQFSQGNEYVLSITDTGIGIAPHDLERIFDRFAKAGSAIREGYGLGLSIVRTIANFHNMTISIDSEVGIGTTVIVHIPAVLQRMSPFGSVNAFE